MNGFSCRRRRRTLLLLGHPLLLLLFLRRGRLHRERRHRRRHHVGVGGAAHCGRAFLSLSAAASMLTVLLLHTHTSD